MKHMHTPSHTFIAVKFDTTGSVLRKPLEVVKKFSIVVTPIITRAGTAFHSSQKVMKDEVTRMMPGMKTVVK